MKRILIALLLVGFMVSPCFGLTVTWTQPSVDTLKGWNFYSRLASETEYKFITFASYTGQTEYYHDLSIGNPGESIVIQIEAVDTWDRVGKTVEVPYDIPLPPFNDGIVPINIVITP